MLLPFKIRDKRGRQGVLRICVCVCVSQVFLLIKVQLYYFPHLFSPSSPPLLPSFLPQMFLSVCVCVCVQLSLFSVSSMYVISGLAN